MAKSKRKKKNEARELMSELMELFLRDGAGLEVVEKGFYHKIIAGVHNMAGDRNVEGLARMKEVVEKLDKLI